MKNKIRQGGAAIALIIFVSLFGTVIRAVARAGPLIQTSTVTPSPSPSNTPSPSPSETPTQTPTETPKPTETMSPGEYVSAMTVVNRCMYYEDLVTFWIELEPPEYKNITVEHVPLILAIMAEESGCDKNVDASHAHAIGLMQVIPRSWTASAECLKRPSCGIYWGIKIYDYAINIADGDVRTALSLYNCSEKNVNKQLSGEDINACGPTGGVHYADSIMQFWLPLILEKMEE